ncbi:hypothetical protein [Halomonas lysinitropha]|uniref:Uncharacterized protein n=1 Tax=Halomonas lysinitropha TaxID=2607506 RepID=A0A5K1I8L4_9GAMM|nr:hypothetical protein [Halomonas lysinitropha]VVZ96523.1 hypothetical protein HALO32_02624 [Halomonas lysinitropha]
MSVWTQAALPIATTLAGGLIGWAASLANSRRAEYNHLTHDVRVGLEKLIASDSPETVSGSPSGDDLTRMKASLRNRDRKRIAPKAAKYLAAQREAHATDKHSQPVCTAEQREQYLSAAQELREAVAVK